MHATILRPRNMGILNLLYGKPVFSRFNLKASLPCMISDFLVFLINLSFRHILAYILLTFNISLIRSWVMIDKFYTKSQYNFITEFFFIVSIKNNKNSQNNVWQLQLFK